MAPIYRLITLGGLSIERDATPFQALAAQRKALALLAVVAASGPAGVSRDRLLALFWPESDSVRARGALKQMLHSMRRQLGPDDVVTGTASLSLNPEQIESDLADFLAALQSRRLEDAVAAYTGDFLDGVHIDGSDELDRWTDMRRRELAAQFASALEALARMASARGSAREAADWWRRRQAVDPLSSRVAVELMQALDAGGDQPAAIRHARVHDLLVREETGFAADPAVAALAAALASGTTARAPRIEQVSDIGSSEQGSGVQAVEPLPLTPSPPPVATTAPVAPRGSRWSSPAWFVATCVGSLLVAVLLWRTLRERAATGRGATLDPRRVAIAVFDNRTGDTLLAPLGLMAADWISRGLARTAMVDVLDVGTLYVQGRTPTGSPTDPRGLARSGGAGLVVEGRYYRTADSVWFTASIVDVASGRVIRVVDPIGAATAEPLAAVDELRQRVAAGLGTILDPHADFYATPSTSPPTFGAYREFVIAQDLYWRGAFDAAFPHFRRAVELDSTFDTAAAWVTVNAAGVGRCDVVDSVAASLSVRRATLGPWEQFTLGNSLARCVSDWEEANRLQRARLVLQPGSSLVRWTLAIGYRALGQPSQSVALLAPLDPTRDFGWMSDHAKVLYWRELTAARHAIGDFEGELADTKTLAQDGSAPLATAYVRARALAGMGRAVESLRALDRIDALSAEPGLVAGTTGRMRPREVATPGWVFYQIGTELAAHGAAAEGLIACERASIWFTKHADVGPLSLESRFVWAQSLVLIGRTTAGLALLDTLSRSDPTSVELRGALGVFAAVAGDSARARAVALWLASRPPRFPLGLPALYRARIAAVLGDSTRALDLLDGLPHGAHPNDLGLLHNDPAFASLRGNPRFLRLVRPRT